MASLQDNSGSSRLVRFGVFEADLEAGELRKSGLKIALQEQPYNVLRLLLLNPGKVVSREEIQQELWPADTFVEFDRGLNTAMTKVREALGDSAGSPRFIETVPRRGYRFVAPVETAAEKRDQTPMAKPSHRVVERVRSSPWVAALTGALVTAVVIIGWEQIRRPEPVTDLPLRKFDLAFAGLTLDAAPAISADGRYLAFVAGRPTEGTSRLRVYDFGRGESHEIAHTEGAKDPFWSPDSEYIGFVVGSELKKVGTKRGQTNLFLRFSASCRN